jgi:O-antigen biosynthesis protein WbqP
MYRRFLKRVLDIILSALLILVLAPVLLVVAIVVKIDSPGPVFFTQKRVGLHKKHFTILKFRSMPVTAPKDTPTHQLQNAEAILSKWQRFIRKSSIDELPQLFCIFVGTMSFIGPRPALWNQFDLIEERDKYGANDVQPGLTGWAQINGRDELPIGVKASLDGEYVERLSFGFDCKCFFGTFKSVLRSEGVVEGGTGEIERKQAMTASSAETVVQEKKTDSEETLIEQ